MAWEDGDSKHLLGSGVPEALSSSITGFIEAIGSGAVTSESAEWVLSVAGPNRALFGKPGPGDGDRADHTLVAAAAERERHWLGRPAARLCRVCADPARRS